MLFVLMLDIYTAAKLEQQQNKNSHLSSPPKM